MSDRMSWDKYFVRMSRLVAMRSPDRSKKVGTVLVDPRSQVVLSTGYNGFPRGMDSEADERHERPGKYERVVHSEVNAVVNAAVAGVSVCGAVAYMESSPCRRCANTLINAGITEVVACVEDPAQNQFATDREGAGDWVDDRSQALDHLRECGVMVRYVDLPREKILL